MLIAIIVGILVTFWANLDITFRNGAVAKAGGFKGWVGRESFNRLQRWLHNPTEPNMIGIGFMGIGALPNVCDDVYADAFPVVALPPSGLRPRNQFCDGLLLVRLFRGVVPKIDDFTARRFTAASSGCTALLRFNLGRLRHR